MLEAFSLDKPSQNPEPEQQLVPGSAAKSTPSGAPATPKTPTAPATITAALLSPPSPQERLQQPPTHAMPPLPKTFGKPPLPKFIKPERVPHGHVIEDGPKVCAACRREIGSHGGGCFFAFDRVFCTSFCQQRFIKMAAHAKATRRLQPPQPKDGL